MITEETLEKFVQHTATLLELAARIGFNNLRLLTPALPEQKDSLHLLVDRLPDKAPTMFDKTILVQQIRDLVGCSVCVVTEPQISKILREKMLVNPIRINDSDRVRSLFQDKLIPFSEENYSDDEESEEEMKSESNAPRTFSQ